MNKQEIIDRLEYNQHPLASIQEEIEWNNALDFAIDIIKEELDEPEKPVVPQYVADWIDYCKRNHLTITGAFDPVSGLGIELAEIYKGDACKCTRWALDNQDIFARAWVNGYEVEKEKLYTVELPNPNNSGSTKLYLAKYKNDKVELFSWSGYTSIEFADDWKKEENAQLTEKEIKEDFDWAWQFAEEVKK